MSGNVMQYIWKSRDVFYTNGIVNLFWATQQIYSTPYEATNNHLLLHPMDNLTLDLYPHQMVLEGEEDKVREWYRDISYFFTQLGLDKTPRIVFDAKTNSLVEGYSFRQRPYTQRIWGTSIGAKLISAPSLDKSIPNALVEQALTKYERQAGKTVDQLSKEGLFKKDWQKAGVYVQVDFEDLFEALFKNRHQFEESPSEQCEICGSHLVKFNDKAYRRDSQTYPTVIGFDYSGFKEFMQHTKMLVCAFCDIALRYNFFWSFYVDGKPNILIHLDYPDLVALFKLKSDVFSIQMEDVADLNQSTNIPFPSLRYYASVERAILGIALYITDRIATEKKFAIDYISGENSNLLKLVTFYFDSTQILGFTEYHQFNKLVQWLSHLPKEAMVKPLKKDLFRVNSKNNQYLTETNLLSRILNFQDISAPLAEIASLKVRGVKTEKPSTELFISPYPLDADFENLILGFYQYIKECVMNEDQLQLLKDYGWALGTLARSLDDLAVFYELREAKKLDHVINVLRNFSFKLLREEETIQKRDNYGLSALGRFVGKDMEIVHLFESLKDQWMKARDLLLFFAVNNYLKKYDSKQGD